jgi:hypothetical protein
VNIVSAPPLNREKVRAGSKLGQLKFRTLKGQHPFPPRAEPELKALSQEIRQSEAAASDLLVEQITGRVLAAHSEVLV